LAVLVTPTMLRRVARVDLELELGEDLRRGVKDEACGESIVTVDAMESTLTGPG
jgi:hypothetical protein